MINSSKAPREPCIAFEKLDGSNIRVKYTSKKGFHLFGSRHQLFDKSHPHLAGAIDSFNESYSEPLARIFKDSKLFSKPKEIIVFGEYYGIKSFAGVHDPEDKTKRFVMFDVLLVYKDHVEFLLPQYFTEYFLSKVAIPNIVFDGKLNDEFIQDVRDNNLSDPLIEGVICKGTKSNGAFRGKTWMCKIKTTSYLNKLKERYGNDWIKYGE